MSIDLSQETKIGDVEKNGEFETRTCKFKMTAALYKIMYSGIYNRPIEAVIREISTNAADAHIEAGNPEPFDVHLPNRFNQTLEIRDYGPGLSEEFCMENYGDYGDSDKKNKSDQTGSKGLGSKSPLAICDSFIVESFYDGRKMTFSIFKDEYDFPNIAKIADEPSDEPTGICVRVNTSGKEWEFKQAAKKVYGYFKQTPNIDDPEVLEAVETFKNSWDIKHGDWAVKKVSGELKAVMGNVSYTLPEELNLPNYEGYIEFPIDALECDPGRERIQLDFAGKTEEVVKEKVKEIEEKLCEEIIEKIEAEETPFKQWKKKEELNGGSFSKIINRNKELFKKFNLPKYDNPEVVSYDSYDGSRMVTEYLPNKTCYYRAKPKMVGRIKAYCKRNYKSIVVLTDEQIGFFKVDEEFLSDLDDLPELPKDKKSYSKIFKYNGKHRSWAPKDNWDVVELDLSEEFVYVEISYYRDDFCYTLQHTENCLKELGIPFPEIYGVKSAEVRKKKFKESAGIHLTDYLREKVKDKTVSVSKYSGLYSEQLAKLGFKRVKKLAEKAGDTYLADFVKYFGGETEIDDSADRLEKEILDRYPLLELLIKNFKWEKKKELIKEYMEMVDKNDKLD